MGAGLTVGRWFPSLQLAHYRLAYGRDYHSFRTKFASVIVMDSESLVYPAAGAVNRTVDPAVQQETDAQWAWLEQELAAAVVRAKP